MARSARLAFAGEPHFILHRGRGNSPTFEDDVDRRTFLEAVHEAARSGGVAVHAYALADREVQMLATPAAAEDLGRFMQRVGRRYVAAFNARHGRRGPLWDGRFRASAIEADAFFMDCVVSIEQLPVRRGLCVEALAWAWSSASHHAGSARCRLVEEHAAYWRSGNTPFERQARHAARLEIPVQEPLVRRLQAAARGGWPIGSQAYLDRLAILQPRPLRPLPIGRPAAKQREA